MPTTWLFGRPENFCSAHTIASSGLVMQMTKALGAYFLMPAPTCSMTLRLMPSRSSRLMPGLRGTPAVTMQTSAPSMRGIVVDAGEAGVEALDRRGLGDVETLALRNAFGNIEQDDVAEFLEADQMGERAADHAGADEGDLVACHVGSFPFVRKPPGTGAAGSVGPEDGGDASRIRRSQ